VFTHDFTSFDDAIQGIQGQILKLAVEGRVEEVHKKDVQEVLNSHKEKLLKKSFNSTRMKTLNLTTKTLQS
jgi:hypothetical protein